MSTAAMRPELQRKIGKIYKMVQEDNQLEGFTDGTDGLVREVTAATCMPLAPTPIKIFRTVRPTPYFLSQLENCEQLKRHLLFNGVTSRSQIDRATRMIEYEVNLLLNLDAN